MTTFELAVVVLIAAVSASLCMAGIYDLKRASSPKKSISDQKCPYCDTWQAEVGGWAWVGNSDNPMVDFAAECAECGMYSDWVWIGPGVCATYEEITKQ